jgi:riboflavin synthase
MFTGLIETAGRIGRIDSMAGGVRLHVTTHLGKELAVGDSIATNGVCLTVVATATDSFATEVSPQTLHVTSLGQLGVGSLVNLERPLRADTRMGGHFVLGHVDGTGRVVRVIEEGEFWRFTFSYPADLAVLFIPKGSVAVDGISLTVAELRDGEFDVAIIPHTWEATNLRALAPGDLVNLECDMLGKYVVRVAALMEQGRRVPPSLIEPATQ